MTRPKPPARRPRRSYHHGDLRRALLDEAAATIRTDGVDALTLRGIGARLGVSRTALYRHFADKRALLTAVATEGFRTLRQELIGAWEAGGGGEAAFHSMGLAYVRFAVSNPSHYRVMFGGFVDRQAPDPDLAAEAEGAFRALVDALAALRGAGLVRGDDTEQMARHVWALVHGVAMLGIDRQLREPEAAEELTRYALERLWTGIGAGPEPRTPGRTGAARVRERTRPGAQPG